MELTYKKLESIIVTAFEGGIGYWAGIDMSKEGLKDRDRSIPLSIASSHILEEGGSITILDQYDDTVAGELTKKKIDTAFRKFLSKHNFSLSTYDMCEFDADCADEVIQFALFGKWVYG